MLVRRCVKVFALGVLQLLVFGFVGIATAADNTIIPAGACTTESIYPGGRVLPDSSGGLFTFDSIPGVVTCGVGQDQAIVDTNDDLRVYFKDTNPGAGQDFYCFASSRNADNSIRFSTGTVYGCATPGGCASSSTYQGSNYLTLRDIRHGGAYATAVTCFIPPAPPNAFDLTSTLVSFLLDEQ